MSMDKYPVTPSEEVQAIRQDDADRASLLADLPDTTPVLADICACGHELGWHTSLGFCGECRCEQYVFTPREAVA